MVPQGLIPRRLLMQGLEHTSAEILVSYCGIAKLNKAILTLLPPMFTWKGLEISD